jgi:hypothetical protein
MPLLQKARQPPLSIPDGRYVVVRGRLWRTSNPALDASERQRCQVPSVLDLVGLLSPRWLLSANVTTRLPDAISPHRDVQLN